MYYDRYPQAIQAHPTKNYVLIIYAKKETTAYSVTQSIRRILLFSTAQGPQHTTKINQKITIN